MIDRTQGRGDLLVLVVGYLSKYICWIQYITMLLPDAHHHEERHETSSECKAPEYAMRRVPADVDVAPCRAIHRNIRVQSSTRVLQCSAQCQLGDCSDRPLSRRLA